MVASAVALVPDRPLRFEEPFIFYQTGTAEGEVEIWRILADKGLNGTIEGLVALGEGDAMRRDGPPASATEP